MKTIRKALKWALTHLLTGGVVVAIGLLSYCGMLVLFPSIPLALLAFIFAGLVEGEVFKQNITNGVAQLKLLGKKGLSHLIERAIDEQVCKASPETIANTPFLQDYLTQQAIVKSFQHKKLTAAEKKRQAKEKARLERMRQYWVLRILEESAEPLSPHSLIAMVRKTLPALRRKRLLIYVSLPFCVAAGIGFGFATASALNIALLSLSLSALTPLVWPLAAVACVGYVFLIYNTVSDIICNETLSKWKHQIAAWFKKGTNKHGEKESAWRHGLRVTGIGLLLTLAIGLGVLATLATAGTWWLAVKEGARLLPWLVRGANIIRNIIVPITFFTSLVFVLRNSLESVKHIIHTIQNTHPLERLKKRFLNWINSLKQFNPFRFLAEIIAAPFKMLVFIGHLIATGLAGDRTPGLSRSGTVASAVAGALSDGLVDGHYMDPGDHEEEHDHGVTSHHDHEHGHDHGHDDHDHGLLLDAFLKVLLSPLYFLAAVWDFLVTPVTFRAALTKNFNIKTEPPYVAPAKLAPLSTAWLQQEKRERALHRGLVNPRSNAQAPRRRSGTIFHHTRLFSFAKTRDTVGGLCRHTPALRPYKR